MSPNKNYVSGRNFEYKRKKFYKDHGYEVVRASGSHGKFDLVCLKHDSVTLAIQCKRVDKATTGLKLIEDFQATPPMTPSGQFVQVMEVYVKETGDILVGRI